MKKIKEDIQEKKTDNKFSKIPSWVYVFLLKYWAAAAAIFFSVISSEGMKLDKKETGTQVFVTDFYLILFIGLFLALFSNYIVRISVRMMYNRRNRLYRYNMININGFLSFVLALGYNFVLSFILYFVIYFMGINGWIFNPFGMTNFGIEPFSYALCYVIVDFLFLFIKNSILDLKARIKYNRESNGGYEDV